MTMKNLLFLSVLIFAISFSFQSCNNGKTYAELKEEEREAIQKFITENDIKVISEDEFLKDTVTNVKENEFVFLEKNGVYMQIVNRGEGQVLENGRHDMSTKFLEKVIKDIKVSGSVISAGDTLAQNIIGSNGNFTESMIVTITGKGSFSAKFTNDKTSNVMSRTYGSPAVPSGWLIPLSYLKLKKYISAIPSEKWVRVNLIVPHSEGTSMAMRSVYPCYYEITYFLH